MKSALVGLSLDFPSGFVFQEVAPAAPGFGQVRIAIEATALGYVDGLIVRGLYQVRPTLPFIPGGEIAGIVDAVGEGVSGMRAGDHVATWQLGGGLARTVVVDAEDVDRLEPGLPLTVAAAMLVDYQTAHYALFERGRLRPEETVLVLGATGSVAAAAVRLAKQAGCFVVAAASGFEKCEAALRLGADIAIDYGASDWRDALRTALPGGTVDVVVDPVGGDSFEQAFRSLSKGGRHLIIGFAGGSIPALPANLALLKSASLVGVDIRHFLAAHPEAARLARRSLFSMVCSGRLAGPEIMTFGLGQAIEALEWTTCREKRGKVVVLPG